MSIKINKGGKKPTLKTLQSEPGKSSQSKLKGSFFRSEMSENKHISS